MTQQRKSTLADARAGLKALTKGLKGKEKEAAQAHIEAIEGALAHTEEVLKPIRHQVGLGRDKNHPWLAAIDGLTSQEQGKPAGDQGGEKEGSKDAGSEKGQGEGVE